MATDFVALRLEYVNGNETLRELADRHGVKPAGLFTRSANEGWEEERKQIQARTSKEAQEQMLIDRVAELAKFNEDDIRIAKAIRAKAAKMLSSDANTPSELKALAGAMDIAQKIGRLALGAETANTMNTVRQLSALSDEEFLG